MRLIDADALECDTEWSEYADDYISYSKFAIDNAPTIDAVPHWIPCEETFPIADAAPVRHGHWIKISPAGIYECSECGKNVMTSDIEAYEYCHGCGARMDAKE